MSEHTSDSAANQVRGMAEPPRCEQGLRSRTAPQFHMQVPLTAPASWEGSGLLVRQPEYCHYRYKGPQPSTPGTAARHPATMAVGFQTDLHHLTVSAFPGISETLEILNFEIE